MAFQDNAHGPMNLPEPGPDSPNYGQNLFFGSPKYVADVKREEDGAHNENWVGYTPTTLYDLNEKVNAIKKEYKSRHKTKLQVKNMVISAHGLSFQDGGRGIPVAPDTEGGSFTEASSKDLEMINAEAIESYFMNKPSSGTIDLEFNSAYKYVILFEKIMGQIEDGGNLILFGCDVGSDKKFLEALFLLGGERINIIANQNITKITGNSTRLDVLDASLRNEEGDSGWVIIGPSTGRQVQAVLGANHQIILSRTGDPIRYE